ncbi:MULTISPECIES: response regulator transcription factor [Amycolatopsis]|uniref:Response regulator n=1 Tax=Amycolatopsis dongchuanensis TaxID=1070866 RepID=A0ABP9Q4M7_9PSEU
MGFTVLVVDDDPGFRRVAGRLLAVRGFEVVGDAADGDQALTEIRARRPDGVLLDLNLPDTDGLTLAERISREPAAPSVVLTSTDSPGYPQRTLAEAGVRAFVPKDQLVGADLAGLFTARGT